MGYLLFSSTNKSPIHQFSSWLASIEGNGYKVEHKIEIVNY